MSSRRECYGRELQRFKRAEWYVCVWLCVCVCARVRKRESERERERREREIETGRESERDREIGTHLHSFVMQHELTASTYAVLVMKTRKVTERESERARKRASARHGKRAKDRESKSERQRGSGKESERERQPIGLCFGQNTFSERARERESERAR